MKRAGLKLIFWSDIVFPLNRGYMSQVMRKPDFCICKKSTSAAGNRLEISDLENFRLSVRQPFVSALYLEHFLTDFLQTLYKS